MDAPPLLQFTLAPFFLVFLKRPPKLLVIGAVLMDAQQQ